MSMSAVQVEGAELRRRWGVPRFGYAANRMMLWIGAKALWAGYVIVWMAAAYFFVCVPKARRASMTFLERVHGRRALPVRWWQTYRHMVVFGILLLDRAVMLAGERERAGFEMSVQGLEHLRGAMAPGRGLVMMTAHFGIAEAAAPYMERMGMMAGRRMHLVMYQDLKDATERFHSAFRKMLERMEIISTTDALGAGLKIMAALKAGDVVGIRGDRALEGRTIGVDFLGGLAEFPAGPFVAAALSGAPIVSIYTFRRGYRKYGCVVSPAMVYGGETQGSQNERAERAARDYAAFLEKVVRENPYQWSNFYEFWGEEGTNAVA